MVGLTEHVFDGTASPEEMAQYQQRTISPLLTTIATEFTRKFISRAARGRGHEIMFFKALNSFYSMDELSKFADTFTRNEILSSNELRGILGYMMSNDPKADELRNKNISQSAETIEVKKEEEEQ